MLKTIGCLVALAPSVVSSQATSEAAMCEQINNRSGKPEEVRAQAQAVISARPTSASAAFFNGCMAISDNRADKAADFFELATEKEQKSHYFDWLGRAYGEQAQRANKLKQPFLARKTKNAFEKAVALDPDNLDARNYLVQFYQIAPGIMGGSEEKARQQIGEMQKRNAYRGGLANAGYLLRAKDAAGAEREFEALTRSHPDSLAPWSNVIGLRLNAHRWNEAFAAAEAMRARPGRTNSGDYAIGRIAAISGEQLARGEAALRKYLTTSPAANEPPIAMAHFRLAQILQAKKDVAAARAEFQETLKLQPANEDAKKALAGLK